MVLPLQQLPRRAEPGVLELGRSELPQRDLPPDRVAKAYERMKAELLAAARIQRSLLPKSSLSIDGAGVAWRFLPASELGGDMFDVVQLDASHIGIYLLDVTGHGACPALLAVTVSQLLSHMPVGSLLFQENGDQTAPLLLPPAKVARRLNERFPMNSDCRQYFTFLYGILDLATGEFRYVGAGQPGPVLVHEAGPSELLPSTAAAIGWFPDSPFEDRVIRLGIGDRLYLYSDGVVEAEGPRAEQFCVRRLAEVAEHCQTSGLEESLDTILRSLEGWCANRRPVDDISLLGIEFMGTSSDAELVS